MAIIIGAVIASSLVFLTGRLLLPAQPAFPAPTPVSAVTVTPTLPPSPQPATTGTVTATPTGTPSATPTATETPTETPSATPTVTPTFTPTPTPTIDLSKCNAAGCGLNAAPLPTVEYDYNMLLQVEPSTRRNCPDCPPNERLSPAELNTFINADPPTLARLQAMVLSQQAQVIAPGIVYINFNNAHHVVVDLQESGFVIRNIIPNGVERGTLITPSYCMSEKSLVVINADYHGLNGSNKTEDGRDLFYHLGRAALFERDGQFDIGVIPERPDYDRTTRSWGGGPIFLWDGAYNYNPFNEWFEPDDLEYYRDTRWAKMTVALSENRKYLFITASYGLTLKEHAENIIELGRRWGMPIDRAMRFDGGESTYITLRLGDHLVPVLNLPEPLIVNCLAIERIGE